MLDPNAKGRFPAATAGPNYGPIDSLSIDSGDWLNAVDVPGFVAYPTLTAGQFYSWRTPESLVTTPFDAAGCRLRVVASADSVVRMIAVDDAAVAASGLGSAAALLTQKLPHAPAYAIPNGAERAWTPWMHLASTFGLYLVSGAIAFELHWLRAD